MFTTANNRMTDGVRFLGTGQTSPTGASIAWTAPDGLPDLRWGWGIPDLSKGMYGPGQFLSPMTYNMNKAPLDVWSNNISQVAIKARQQEYLTWLNGYKAQGIAFAGDYSPNVLNLDGTVKPNAFVLQGILGVPGGVPDPYIVALTGGHPEMYDKIPYQDAQKWRKEWMDARVAYIQNNIDHNLYTASLTKQGFGTLVMSGNNTYEGGTTVEGGKLSINGSQAGTIVVKGGTLGGSGSVAGNIDVVSGVLQPGFTSAEAQAAQQISQVAIAPGDILKVGGDVRIRDDGRLAVTIRSDTDYTSVQAKGDVVLDGKLDLDVQGRLHPGSVLTIMEGGSVRGHFDQLPLLLSGGYLFGVSSHGNNVKLTVMFAAPYWQAKR
jgi:autotransporter-associated beta strand protein